MLNIATERSRKEDEEKRISEEDVMCERVQK